MPDLLAGSIIYALDTPPTVKARDDTSIGSITGTGFVAGSPVVGVAFVACTTGRALVKWKAQVDNTTTDTLVGYRIGTGSTIGAGTQIVAPDDAMSISMTGSSQVQNSMEDLVEGLTPGSTYNVQLMHRITSGGGSGAVSRRSVIVAPAT